MRRSQLVAGILRRHKWMSAQEANDCVDGILNIIGDTLAAGGRVEIRGFGIFYISQRAARRAINPRDGELIVVPPKTVARFRAGAQLRHDVDPNFAPPKQKIPAPKPARKRKKKK